MKRLITVTVRGQAIYAIIFIAIIGICLWALVRCLDSGDRQIGSTYSHSGPGNTYNAEAYNSINVPVGPGGKRTFGDFARTAVAVGGTLVSGGASGWAGLGKQLLQTGWQAALTGLENRIAANVGGKKAAQYGNPGGGYAAQSALAHQYATSQAGSQGQYLSFQAAENALNRQAASDSTAQQLRHDAVQRHFDRRLTRELAQMSADGVPAGQTPGLPGVDDYQRVYYENLVPDWFKRMYESPRDYPTPEPTLDIGMTSEGRHYGSIW